MKRNKSRIGYNPDAPDFDVSKLPITPYVYPKPKVIIIRIEK